MTEKVPLDHQCPGCQVMPGYRHARHCDTPCRTTGLPLSDCRTATHTCLADIWCPPVAKGLVAVALVEDDPLLTMDCEQCEQGSRPGDIVVLPKGEDYLFHLGCLIGLAAAVQDLLDPRQTQEDRSQEAFNTNKAALIAYLQRTST
jgi:hypothetical protein